MEYHRKAGEISALTSSSHRILVVGIGSAGANILRRIALDGGDPSLLACMDTDAGTLSGSVAANRVQLGRNLTRGLTAGGDPDLGRDAAIECEQEIRKLFRGVDLVFLCTGLGGGTASGASPVIARLAKEEGCFVLVFVTLPFHFEGRRRQVQAREALAQIKSSAGALLTFENDRMGQLIVPTEGVQKAFAVADTTICHSIRAITTMLEKPGMIQVGKEQLLAVLNGQDAKCLFGFGKATGSQRASVAVRAALENPLLNEGDLLKSASTVLVHISGSRSVTFSEVEQVMGEISKGLDPSTEVLFGVSASEELGDELWVAVISSVSRSPVVAMPAPPAPIQVAALHPSHPPARPEPTIYRGEPAHPLVAQQPKPEPEQEGPLVPLGPSKPKLKAPLPMPASPAPIPTRPAPVPRRLIGQEHFETPQEPVSPVAPLVPPPHGSSNGARGIAPLTPVPGVHVDYARGAGADGNGGQPTITLDQPPFTRPGSPLDREEGVPLNGSSNMLSMRHRGRFENAEPTVIEGQDMDLPTYIRKLRRTD